MRQYNGRCSGGLLLASRECSLRLFDDLRLDTFEQVWWKNLDYTRQRVASQSPNLQLVILQARLKSSKKLFKMSRSEREKVPTKQRPKDLF